MSVLKNFVMPLLCFGDTSQSFHDDNSAITPSSLSLLLLPLFDVTWRHDLWWDMGLDMSCNIQCWESRPGQKVCPMSMINLSSTILGKLYEGHLRTNFHLFLKWCWSFIANWWGHILDWNDMWGPGEGPTDNGRRPRCDGRRWPTRKITSICLKLLLLTLERPWGGFRYPDFGHLHQ